MAKVNPLDVLYSEEKSPLDFHFDSLMGPNISYFFNQYEIVELYNIARSNKLAGNIKKKKQMINEIVEPKGFRRLFSGTNRVIYRYLEDTSFCLKIAFDTVGLSDSLREYENQFYLKPFCVKIFDSHPCGVVATVEYVQPIRTIYEFGQVAGEVFDLIVNRIIGKYVLDDIGCVEFFQNYGVRKGFGPVLLDFPYMYKLDGNKLYCCAKDKSTGKYCSGIIDYDATFDNIICTKCGKRYFAKDLKANIDKDLIFVKGVKDMSKVWIYRGNTLVSTKGGNESDFIDRSESKVIPSSIQQQLDDDFIICGNFNYQPPQDVKIPNFEQKIIQEKEVHIERSKSTFIPSPEDIHNQEDEKQINIPSNLGDIISQNSLDEDEEAVLLNKFNLNSSDFEEKEDEDNNENIIDDEVDLGKARFERIKKIGQKKDTDSFY